MKLLQTQRNHALLALIFLFGTSMAIEFEGGLPGCGCEPSTCQNKSLDTGLLPCWAMSVSDSDTRQNITNQNGTICDSILDNDPETEKYVEFQGGEGTCEEAYTRQATCPSNYTDDVAIGSKLLSPGTASCSRFPTLPLRYYTHCGFDGSSSACDGFKVFIEYDDNNDRCDLDAIPSLTPKLTSADWIEPSSNRRYMCYDGVLRNQQKYYFLVMHLGDSAYLGGSPDSAAETHAVFSLLSLITFMASLMLSYF